MTQKGLLKTYLVESSNKLKFVEWEGTGTASQIQYELIRSAAVDPFQDKVKISGNFGLRGGIGFITECFTAYDFPVSKVKDYPRLLQNYMNTPHVSGQPLLVSVIGTINTGENDQTELVIEKFRSIRPENNCEGDKITSSLTGTFWRLIEVDTAQVTQTAGNKSVYLMLDSDRSFSAYGGCNLISGSYLLKGDQVVITRQKEARMACLDRIYLENKFIEALDSSQSLLVDGNILELKDQNNQVRARFQAGTLEQTNKQK